MRKLSFTILISMTVVFCVSIVWLLFRSYENTVEKENPFIRKFESNLITYDKSINVGYNSYYFAGYDETSILLGNKTATLHALSIDPKSLSVERLKIPPNERLLNSGHLVLRVELPYFYLLNGAVPIIFKGKVKVLKPTFEWSGETYFNKVKLIDSNTILFRANRSDIGDNILGELEIKKNGKVKLFTEVLQRQENGDGIFDTDGTMMFEPKSSLIVYLYKYRNQFVVSNRNGEIINLGHTIDTMSRAKLHIEEVEGNRIIGSPPTIVNHTAAIYNDLLFVHSGLRGRYDNLDAFKKSATIDVYNYRTSSYLYSFYLSDIKGQRMREFIVTDKHIYALIGTDIVVYTLSKKLQL